MIIPNIYAAIIPTFVSSGITALYLIFTRQTFFNEYSTASDNLTKLGHNFKTLTIGTCGSFIFTKKYNQEKYFNILDVFYYAIILEFCWYWLHRSIHHRLLYKKIHKLHHHAVVVVPADAYIMSAAEVLLLTACFAVPAYIIDVSQSTALFVTSLYATAGLLEHGAMYEYRFHDYHHLNPRYNYGYFIPMFDYLFGTYR